MDITEQAHALIIIGLFCHKMLIMAITGWICDMIYDRQLAGGLLLKYGRFVIKF